METPKEGRQAHPYPISVEKVAEQEHCAVRTVQNWAAKNNVAKVGGGSRAPFIFFEEDIARFRLRERPGRRWPAQS
jgi:hypothetical protein